MAWSDRRIPRARWMGKLSIREGGGAGRGGGGVGGPIGVSVSRRGGALPLRAVVVVVVVGRHI